MPDTMEQGSDMWLARARALHRRAVVIDAHCDTTQRLMRPAWDFARRHDDGHVDLPRLREGGVGAVIFAVFAMPSGDRPGADSAAARAQLDRLHAVSQEYSAHLGLARTADDVRTLMSQGRVAMLIGIEGGHLIENSLELLREFRERGAVYMTLTHAAHNDWADSAGVHEDVAPRHNGLTRFGKEVIGEMNRLGMMIDVSHVSDRTFWDVLETSTVPVMASHSSCRSVAPHRRNLSDEMIRAVAKRGGTVQINFAAAFVDAAFPQPDPEKARQWMAGGMKAGGKVTDHVTPFERLVEHFDHALRLVGPDHVGIGSDFDGVMALPEGMEHCGRLPHLTAALLQRGYSESDLEGVLGVNVLRVMTACQTGKSGAT